MIVPLVSMLCAWPIFALLFFPYLAMASSNDTTPRIIELAAQISSSVTKLQDKLSAQGAATPSFAENGPEVLPDDVSSLKDAVLDATAELHEILLDPLFVLFKFASIENLVTLDGVCRYKIPDMISPGDKITFDEISEKTGLEKYAVRRLVRHAITMRIFDEPEHEVITHSKISKFLTNPSINGWVEFEARDTWPATTRIIDALQKWPNSQLPNQTGFVLANNGKTVPEVVASNPEVAGRFRAGMEAMNLVPGYSIENVSTVYDWASLGNATVVHGMGSRGQAAFELAKKFPNLKFIVQDSKGTLAGVNSTIPSELASRVKFQEHELFAPQDAEADVYFFRMVFRGFGDAFAAQALKAQIPALRPGVKILIQDVVMPEPEAIPLWRDRVARSVDLAIEAFSNGRERYLEEWKALLAAADERFVLHKVFVPEESLLGIIEVHWNESFLCRTIAAAAAALQPQPYARHKLVAMPSVILNTVCISCLTVAFHYGFGKHDHSLTFYQAVHIAKWIWMSFTPGITSSIASRISIAFLLVRIFGIHTWLKWSLIVITVIQVVGSVVLALTSWLQVRPVQGLWDPTIPAKRISPEVVAREGNVAGGKSAAALGCISSTSKKSTWSETETGSIDPGTVRRTDQFDVRSDQAMV
ncbi:putative Sterigmatocystin 8-O-methyltransferase [Paraphaeosphaeria sporulosa]|uniref:Putative Sterigmatocystin 8-O-methyltransferase n=1 Tax=Paraphaeosphaeria sporulosa TaxID=1460663 RepID=A0A177C4Q9_9PLEO|nr:putative Sterigmatocystin 8-O-methyltransferase [Paraphaeosphaeria sporulosa]OAG01869.1 putative Sterigmatocystin 8-O-methyltransferase [Paraphaeosphaeria sporulosa]